MKYSEADAELAMGDEAEWEQPERSSRKKSERRQRGAVVSVRLTPAELETVQERAAALGLSVGAFMRARALEGTALVGTRESLWGAHLFYSMTGPQSATHSAFAVSRLPRSFQRWESSAESLVDH